MKKKDKFERLNKKTGEIEEIKTATAAEPIKDRTVIEKIKTELNIKKTRKYYALFCTGINVGLRISDLLQLKVNDVKSGYVRTKETKTGKFKQFPINATLKAVLDNYIEEFKFNDEDFLFFTNKRDKTKNKCIDQSQVYRKLKEVIKKVAPELHVSTHTLRKTFGFWLYQQTKDIALVMHALNHSSQSATLRYLGLTQESIDNAVNELNL
ncbi:tyrosine-type recombinase/integrase [Methanobrevibacter sp.]|uniref:tyrosine-type recombinase/integrase n=1 Tax=Methanobrevibacter sp. TaxID=66852 RepID=UPI00386DF2AC